MVGVLKDLYDGYFAENYSPEDSQENKDLISDMARDEQELRQGLTEKQNVLLDCLLHGKAVLATSEVDTMFDYAFRFGFRLAVDLLL